MKHIVPAAVALIVLHGCAPPGTEGEAQADSLREAAVAYAAAASSKNADAVVAFYDADALMIPPDAGMVDGFDAVRAFRFGFIDTPGVELSFEVVRTEVSLAGDIGWTLALGDVTIEQEDGAPIRDRVRDFHTWRRQPDGTWKVVVDIWNSGPVPEP